MREETGRHLGHLHHSRPLNHDYSSKCPPKFQISSSSLRSAGGRMPHVRLSQKYHERTTRKVPLGREQRNTQWKYFRFPYELRIAEGSLLMFAIHSRTHKAQPRNQPDQIQGPMQTLLVHPRSQGLGQGGEAEAESASWYVFGPLRDPLHFWIGLEICWGSRAQISSGHYRHWGE